MSNTKSYSYKGYIVSSSPHSAEGGRYVVNGWITDNKGAHIDMVPYSGSKIYDTREEADKAFFNFAINHIDEM